MGGGRGSKRSEAGMGGTGGEGSWTGGQLVPPWPGCMAAWLLPTSASTPPRCRTPLPSHPHPLLRLVGYAQVEYGLIDAVVSKPILAMA